jgi:G6PDH family F420-dependent oxidoreductase
LKGHGDAAWIEAILRGVLPPDLVHHAVMAEKAGLDFVDISDHFHPWFENAKGTLLQGHSGFAWSILGMVAARTERILLGTGVTCPSVRYHPAIIAQAAATMAILSQGRFFLGIGSGERLNEHIVGRGWHSVRVRHEMMCEALQIIRQLWGGGFQTFNGQHLQLEDARIYDLPETLPEIIVAAAGPRAARIAAAYGDGMFITAPDADLVREFDTERPPTTVLAEMVVGFDTTRERGLKAVSDAFRFSALGTPIDAEIPRASHFQTASQFVKPADLTNSVAAGQDPQDYLTLAGKFAAAGVTGLSMANTGPSMEKFLDFAERHLLGPIHDM